MRNYHCLDYKSLLRLYRLIDSSDEEVLAELQNQSQSPLQLPEGSSDQETKLMKVLQLDRFEESLCDDYRILLRELSLQKFSNSLLDNVINIPNTFTEERKATVRYDMLSIMKIRCVMLHRFPEKGSIVFESNVSTFDAYRSRRRNKLNSKTGNIMATTATPTTDNGLQAVIADDERTGLRDGREGRHTAQTVFETENVRLNMDAREQRETILIGFRALLLNSERTGYREQICYYLNGFFNISQEFGNESEVEAAVKTILDTISRILNCLKVCHPSATTSYITNLLFEYFISDEGLARSKQQISYLSTTSSELSFKSTSMSIGQQNKGNKRLKTTNTSEVVISQYPSIKPQQLRVIPDIILEFIHKPKESHHSLHRLPIEVKYVQSLDPDAGKKNFHEFLDQTVKQILFSKGISGLLTNLTSVWLLSPTDITLKSFELQTLELSEEFSLLKLIGFLMKGLLKELHHKRQNGDCYESNWKIFNKVILENHIDYHQSRMSFILLDPEQLKIRIGMNRIFIQNYMGVRNNEGGVINDLKLSQNTIIKGSEQSYDANQLSEALESEMKTYFLRSESRDPISERYSLQKLFSLNSRMTDIGRYFKNHFQVIDSGSIKVLSVLKGSELYGETALNVVARIEPVDQKTGHTFGGIEDPETRLIIKIFDPSRIPTKGVVHYKLTEREEFGTLKFGVINNILLTSKLFLKELLSLIILGETMNSKVPELLCFGYVCSNHFDQYNVDIHAGTTLNHTSACEGFFLMMKEMVEEEPVDNRSEKPLNDETLDKKEKLNAVREYCIHSFLNLRKIHDQFMTHGDISRRNCIFRRDSVNLLDFGLATVLLPEQDQTTEEPASANTTSTLSSSLSESRFLNIGNLMTMTSLSDITHGDEEVKRMFKNSVRKDICDLGSVLMWKFPECEDLVIKIMQEFNHSLSP